MYINDLGAERIPAAGSQSSHISRVGAGNTNYRRKTDSYATAMKKAVERRKTAVSPTFASAGDVIIKEAFEKMKIDPEWEKSVMDKVKAYYTDGAQSGILGWTGTDSLRRYGMQSLLGSQSGYSSYAPYGLGSLAAAAYGTMMNGAFGGSLLGSWQL